MADDRTPTGIYGLDLLIDGGFPRGSLILLAGNPGTGKTIFSAQYIYRGVKEYGEPGIYVSLCESKDAFYKSMMRFGFDFSRLEETGDFRYLDLVTMKGKGVSQIVRMIIDAIYEMKAKRLVIDSFSALVQALEKPIDARILLQAILSRIIRAVKCTTILVSEVPFGSERIGASVEEFVADGVIILRKGEHGEGRLAREISITKMRGTRLTQPLYFFTLEGGFRVFQPLELQRCERRGRFRPINDPPGRFSTGSGDLDRILGGGYPKGGIVLFEIGENISNFNWQLILFPTLANFIAKNRGCLIVPIGGSDAGLLASNMKRMYGFTDDELNGLLRVFGLSVGGRMESPYLIRVKGEDIMEDYDVWIRTIEELKNRTGQPILEVISIDTMEITYGIAGLRRLLGMTVARTRREGNLTIGIVGPGLERVSKRVAALSDIHIKLIRDHGTPLLYGCKPRTALYAVEIDQASSYPLPRLTQMT